MQNKKYKIQLNLLMRLKKIYKIPKMNNSHKQNKKLEDQNGKILLKHYQVIKNSLLLKIRNLKKLMNYSKIIQKIQQLLQNKPMIKKLNKKMNCLNRIINKQ